MNDRILMIQDLIDRYGSSAERIIADGLQMEKVGTSYRCPQKLNHKNGDRHPSMSWVADKNFFYCHACGENITIYSYFKNYLNYRFSEIMAANGVGDITEKRQKFIEGVNSGKGKLTVAQRKFINDRGITDDTIKYFKFSDWNGDIAIPYFLKGHLVALKRRVLNPQDGQPKGKAVTGSKPYLFNVDNVDPKRTLYVTEGEWDAAVVWQIGFQNVVSVGNGATSLTGIFEQAEDFFKECVEIVVLSDNDNAGSIMDGKFIEFLKDKAATVDKSLFKGLKDINNVFLEHGAGQVKRILESGRRMFDGEWDLEAQPYESLDDSIYKFIPTGVESIDKAINDIRTGTVTLITGRSNAGKSTFVNQIVASAINYGFRVYMVVGEGDKNVILNRWYTSMIGYDEKFFDYKGFNKRTIKEPKPEVLQAIREWHRSKLKLFIKALSDYRSTDDLFNMIRYKAQTERYDLIVLDNLMSLLQVEKAFEKNELQARFIEKCHNLAQAYNVAVVVVLHPNKSYNKGDDMAFEQISGSSDIANKSDVIMAVIRVDDPKEIAEGVTAKIQVLKNRDYPDLPTVNCGYQAKTNTYGEIPKGAVKPKETIIQGWQKYLRKSIEIRPEFITLPEQQTLPIIEGENW